ncbi:class I SAM-dependent methyltransferase [Methylocella silvestris]|uniref:Methyltransferase type 11 n=1 Tax=Methylocella silvestris TaxID=199596 RepID=A0A2J7TJ43_METSI|nr:class I SAM-dependent methyltransferase [Methylocella silvestris]PNG26790.1 methyltransferase type 11 [Methylocella silvestris]
MSLDVIDLRSFYDSLAGDLARRLIARIVRERFSNCAGYSILGVGYATPYLGVFRDEAVRVLAFMPAQQGVVHWPAAACCASALVETIAMPLPDSSIDRAILIHGLETTEHPRELLTEIWRVLTPGGRVIIVAPSRSGLWARLDRTPFGHGQPFSRSQLRDLMRDTLFSPTHWTEALYAPPFRHKTLLRAGVIFEKIGAFFGLPGAGVLIVEATKQLYRPVPATQRAQEALPQFAPAADPVGAPISTRSRFRFDRG